MCKTISVISCKGGVGKTTSTVNISAYLQMQGKKVCVVDLDAQHNLSRHFGVWAIPSEQTPTITELFRAAIDDCPDETMKQMVYDSICQTTTVDMIPSTAHLSSLETVIPTATSREHLLEYILKRLRIFIQRISRVREVRLSVPRRRRRTERRTKTSCKTYSSGASYICSGRTYRPCSGPRLNGCTIRTS